MQMTSKEGRGMRRREEVKLGGGIGKERENEIKTASVQKRRGNADGERLGGKRRMGEEGKNRMEKEEVKREEGMRS